MSHLQDSLRFNICHTEPWQNTLKERIQLKGERRMLCTERVPYSMMMINWLRLKKQVCIRLPITREHFKLYVIAIDGCVQVAIKLATQIHKDHPCLCLYPSQSLWREGQAKKQIRLSLQGTFRKPCKKNCLASIPPFQSILGRTLKQNSLLWNPDTVWKQFG